MSFEDLKKNRQESFKKLEKDVTKLEKKTFESDPNEWYPSVDKNGNGFAVGRFLPRITPNDLDFARWWSHEFQDKTTSKWYIENCLFTLDEGADPVMEFNKKLWNSVPGANDDKVAKAHPNRQQATHQSRKIHYVANFYVIEDSVHPENNGRVVKFKFGKWAMDKIEAVMFPKFGGKKKINPFDLWDGANFRIEIISERKDGRMQRSYNTSSFDPPGPLAPDEELEKIYEQYKTWSIKSYLEPKNFKPYADLKKRLDDVVGFDTALWNGKNLTSSQAASEPARSFATAEPKSSASIQKESVSDQTDEFFSSLKKNTVEDDIPF